MKICIFTTSIDKKGGGPARSVPILAKGLSQVGVETTLLTGHSAEMNTHLVDGTSVKIKEVPKTYPCKNWNASYLMDILILFMDKTYGCRFITKWQE